MNLEELGQFRRLMRFLRPYRWRFALALIAVFASSALGLIFPWVTGSLVDSALLEASVEDFSRIDSVALLLLGVFAAQALFSYLRIYTLAYIGEGIVADLRTAVYRNILTLPVKFFDTRKTGEITSRLTSDVGVVQTITSTSLASAISQAITLVGGVALMFVTNPFLSLVVLSFLPLTILTAAFFGRRLRLLSTEFQDRIGDANAAAEEAISAARVVKWFTAEEAEARRYELRVGDSYRVALRRARMRAVFSPFVQLVGYGTLAVVLWVGGRRVVRNELTAGELVTFLLYTVTVAGSISGFTGLYAQLQTALGASRRIFELLDERSDLPEADDPVSLTDPRGSISFENVTFRYADRDIDVLRNVSFGVNPGEVVALVGPSGAGKSTVVQLIGRFFDPTAGRITIDGVDLRDMGLLELRSLIAAVPQETQLFSGTIRENIAMGDPEASEMDITEAAKVANAHDFIVGFPMGYSTVVGEKGIMLSGGQRQRIAIARAVLRDPSILILDEATSSLDSESEAAVQEAMERLMSGRTTVVIAHRLSTVRNAEKLLVLSDGVVVEEGTHEELLQVDGIYSNLHRMQLFDDSVGPASL